MFNFNALVIAVTCSTLPLHFVEQVEGSCLIKTALETNVAVALF